MAGGQLSGHSAARRERERRDSLGRRDRNNGFAHSAYATTDSVRLKARSFLLLFDANSLEAFAGDGDAALSYLLFPGGTTDRLRVDSKDLLQRIKVRKLQDR